MAVVTSSEVINTGYAVLALIADAMVLLDPRLFPRLARLAVGPRTLGGVPRQRDSICTADRVDRCGACHIRQPLPAVRGGPPALHVLLVSAHLHVPALTAARHRRLPRRCARREALLPRSLDSRRGDRHLPLSARARSPRVQRLLQVPGETPCNVAVINIFGFISVPFLSMAAFLLITTLILARARQERLNTTRKRST